MDWEYVETFLKFLKMAVELVEWDRARASQLKMAKNGWNGYLCRGHLQQNIAVGLLKRWNLI